MLKCAPSGAARRGYHIWLRKHRNNLLKILKAVGVIALVMQYASSCHSSIKCPSNDSRQQQLNLEMARNLVDNHNRDIYASYFLSMNDFAQCSEEQRRQLVSGLELSERMEQTIMTAQESFEKEDVFCVGNASFKYEILETFEDLRALPIDQHQFPIVNPFRLPVTDQRDCKSSWAYAASQLIEMQLLKKDKVEPLSTQFFLDCDKGKQSNQTCRGGMAYEGLDVVFKHGGVVPEHLDEGRTCKAIIKTPKFERAFCMIRKKFRVQMLKNWLDQQGPVVVPISVEDDFFFYSKGIYSPKACSNNIGKLNHEVLLVGFGSDKATGVEFWIVKNSWGVNWGEKGYAKIQTGVCGIGRFITLARLRLA